MSKRPLTALAAVGLALATLPLMGLPAFYESFLYLIFSWVALATSWSLLSGYAGYFSFGHGAFFGAGMYTTATLAASAKMPFLWTLPIAGLLSALLALGIGAVVFRVRRLRGELFGLLTLAITFVLATIVLNTRIDGGPGVYLSGVPVPRFVGSPTGTVYLLGLALAVLTVATARLVAESRLGLGLFAIHDDEDVAEVKGVPTFRYKLIAFALSAGIAGVAGGIHAVYVSYVTVGETFSITVPLYVVLMSILGGARHWLGPMVGAVIITASLYLFTGGQTAVLGRAAVALALILVILLLPEGVVPASLHGWRRLRGRSAAPREPAASVMASERPADEPGRLAVETPGVSSPRPAAAAEGHVLDCVDVCRAFGGIQALRGVSLTVGRGEIVGLVGPNGSGKTTLINLVSGHYASDRGRIALGEATLTGRSAHEIARLGVSRTYQIPRPFFNLSVLDNVALAATFGPARIAAGAARAEAREWLAFTGLGRRAEARPGELNLHERKFLELARALASRPRMILLDEVLSGLNPVEIGSAVRLIREIRAQGASILFVEHVMRAVLELSDRVVVLNEGEVIAAGDPREVLRDPHVVRVYLGTRAMLLEARHLAIGYGDAPAVWDASLAVDTAEVVSVIGPNGAGKSTLINSIAGIRRWQSGTLTFDGLDLATVPPHRVCHQGIALVPEGRRLFTRMSVEENLELGAYRPGARRERHAGLERVFELFPILRERRRQLAGALSGGQQQMVAIGRALMARPRLLLLDEPSLGLAPAVVDQMFDIIRAIHGEGVTILLVEQNVTKALEIASRVYVLEEGRTVASGTPAELLARSSIQDAYLGR